VLSTHPTRESALREEARTQAFHSLPGRCFLSEDGAQWWHGRPSNRRQAESVLAQDGLSIDAPLLELNGHAVRTWRAPIVTQARNLLDGMWVLLADLAVSHSRSAVVRVSSWEPIKTTIDWFDGEVVSISVEGDHTYIADGIATHNSWRGAVDAMSTFDADTRLTLSASFRFGPAIATEANKWLELLDAPLRLTGLDSIRSTVQTISEPAAVLCRTNAEAIGQVMAATAAGRRAALVGGGNAIRRMAEAAITLKQGLGTDHPELMAFRTWGELQEYVELDSSGSDLKVFVQLIDDHGPDVVIAAVDQLVEERGADVVVSTAHKAKGREWPTVRIADDFREPKAHDDKTDTGDDHEATVEPGEAMLAYVAVTRARQGLDRTGLAWIDRWVATAPRPSDAAVPVQLPITTAPPVPPPVEPPVPPSPARRAPLDLDGWDDAAILRHYGAPNGAAQ
jgi:hypothetical protein